jgi:hypothetical protein
MPVIHITSRQPVTMATPAASTDTRGLPVSHTQVSSVHVVSSINTITQTCSDEPVATSKPNLSQVATPIPATVTPNSPARTIAPVASVPYGNAPRMSGDNYSTGNPLRSSAPIQSIPQALNNEGQEPSDELETTTLISVGDSTTLTIVTGGPRRTSSISTSSGVQQYTVPAVT